jgi:hypothetical protein
MGCTNTYHGMNYYIFLVEKENATQDMSTHCFGST